ncbi:MULTISPECIES: hypothetical protein [unclassified Microcoleus]|uniref:hypothetical protein n=1 Tax=unclassified Microcoleus TaxID=2642155 RepID=UPI002FD78D60
MKAVKLEIGVRSQESGEKSQKEEVRSKKKCFYKYEMLPIHSLWNRPESLFLRMVQGRHCDRNRS